MLKQPRPLERLFPDEWDDPTRSARGSRPALAEPRPRPLPAEVARIAVPVALLLGGLILGWIGA